MPHEPLSHEDLLLAIVVDDEISATNSLLRSSIELTRDMRWLGQDEYVLTALLAAGMERMLKLTLAFIRVDTEGGAWPVAELKSHGHRIVDLDLTCRRLISQRLATAAFGDRLLEKLLALESDWRIEQVLAIAHDYASGGRYFNLDYLGTADGTRSSPRQRWQRLVDEIKMRWLDPEAILSPSEMPHVGSPGVISTAGGEVSRSLAASIEAWRDFYVTSWEYGLCGARAQQLGQQIAWPYPDSTAD